MKIYKLSQNINNDYDTYDSVVVYAESEDEARLIHPSEFVTHSDNNTWYGTYSNNGKEYEIDGGGWVRRVDVDKIKIELIGISNDINESGVILASFNAG
jgi:hypothetical protein